MTSFERRWDGFRRRLVRIGGTAAAERLVVVDALVAGLGSPQAYAMTPHTFFKTWHFAFNALPDLPEKLIAGRERLYLEWLLRSRSFDPVTAFDAHAIDEYVACYSRAGAMRAGFGYYRASSRAPRRTAPSRQPAS